MWFWYVFNGFYFVFLCQLETSKLQLFHQINNNNLAFLLHYFYCHMTKPICSWFWPIGDKKWNSLKSGSYQVTPWQKNFPINSLTLLCNVLKQAEVHVDNIGELMCSWAESIANMLAFFHLGNILLGKDCWLDCITLCLNFL